MSNIIISVLRNMQRRALPRFIGQVRNFCNKDDSIKSTAAKYQLFEKTEPELILDYDEENDNKANYLYQKKSTFETKDLIKTRGISGVFDVKDLVEALRCEKMADIAVIKVDLRMEYCNYLVLASGMSTRHLKAVALFIRKLYKLKKSPDDPFIIIEGTDCDNWKVIDMNNIVLHLFLPETRDKYDLECLWCVGNEFDEKTQRSQKDHVADLVEKQLEYLSNLQAHGSKENLK